jgi:hypothetical protein
MLFVRLDKSGSWKLRGQSQNAHPLKSKGRGTQNRLSALGLPPAKESPRTLILRRAITNWRERRRDSSATPEARERCEGADAQGGPFRQSICYWRTSTGVCAITPRSWQILTQILISHRPVRRAIRQQRCERKGRKRFRPRRNRESGARGEETQAVVYS